MMMTKMLEKAIFVALIQCYCGNDDNHNVVHCHSREKEEVS